MLTPGEVLVKAAYSSVNYKDALAGTGKGRILRSYPLNGGIDVAGHVVASTDPAFKEGDAVLCTGSGLSETRDGGYAQMVRLPARWTIPLPRGLSLRESMILGTAGFTAALALLRMQDNRQTPELGPIAVTGASGGVGMLAIDIFSRAGYEVHAISGKADHFDFLRSLGASECIDRHQLAFSGKPMDSARFGGALDNVGGAMLTGLLPLISPYGNVAICGNAGGIAFDSTVMPFIIRGASLLGIASAGTARDIRDDIWQHLAIGLETAAPGSHRHQRNRPRRAARIFPAHACRRLVRPHSGLHRRHGLTTLRLEVPSARLRINKTRREPLILWHAS